MSKRPNSTTIANEINEEAKRMAVTWQLKAITDKAARELKKPQRSPPKCRFCHQNHLTQDCTNVIQNEKMKIAMRKKICIICLTHAGHHPANCRTLRAPHLLCQRRGCDLKYQIHNATICGMATPPQSPTHEPTQQDEETLLGETN